jgi:hypothetical protein
LVSEQPIEFRRCSYCSVFGAEVTQGEGDRFQAHCNNPRCGKTELIANLQNAVGTISLNSIPIADSERILGRVYGLGRRYIVGFTLIATDRRIIGVDSGKQTLRLLSFLIAGAMLWLLAFALLVPYMLMVNPALPILGVAAILPTLLLAGRLARRGRAGIRALELLRYLISGIEYYKPEVASGKGWFEVKTRKGSVLRFWAAGRARNDMTTSLLREFCTVVEPFIPVVERPPKKLAMEDLSVLLVLATVLAAAILASLIWQFYFR